MSDSDEGELLHPDDGDYQAIPALDRYEEEMLDDRPSKPMSSRSEMTARRQAEEAMAARDAQRCGRGAEAGGSTRGPRALEQVKANRASNLELERLGSALKCSEAIMLKAENLLKKVYTGTRCLGNGGQMKNLPAACLEIASRVCKKPVNREALLRRAGVDECELPNYTRSLSHCYCLLGIRREVSVADLCSEFKCNAIKTSVRQTLEAYKRQFWASLHEDRRQDADFSRRVSLQKVTPLYQVPRPHMFELGRPVFAVVALYLTAERNKNVVKPPEKTQLLKAGDVQDSEFRRIYDHMKLLALEETKASAAATTAAAAAAAAAAREQAAAEKEAELLKQTEAQVLKAPVFGAKRDAGAGRVAMSDQMDDTGVAESGEDKRAGLDSQTRGNAVEGRAVGITADDRSCNRVGEGAEKPSKVVEDKVRDVATPSRSVAEAHTGARPNPKSAVSTVRKAEARRPVPSAAQRLSNLCSIGVKRAVPVSAPAPEKETQAAEKCARIEKPPCAATPESYLFVASDGKAHAGSKKRQRREEEEAEKASKKELKKQEYEKWRAAQIAELENSKACGAAASSSSAAAVDALSSGPNGKQPQDAQHQDSSPESAPKDAPKGAQTSMLDFIRQKPDVALGAARAPGIVPAAAHVDQEAEQASGDARRDLLARAAEARGQANLDVDCTMPEDKRQAMSSC